MTPIARRASLVAVCAVIAALQIWFWLRVFLEPGYLAHSDLYEQFLPVFLSPISRWSSAEFAGLPVFADPQNTTWYPLHFFFARVVHSWSAYVVSAYVVGGTGAALYAWTISKSRTAAVVAGLAWPWSEAMADLFPHLAMLHGFAWLPWILFGLEQVVATNSRRWLAGTAFAFACLALSGHPQVSIYCGYLVGLYAVALWVCESRRFDVLLKIAGLFALGVGLSAIQMVPTIEASSWIARDKVNFGAFADSFAKKPHELLTTIIPQFCHERREAPTYVGLITLWCAGLAVGAVPRQWRTWFWVAVAAVGLVLGLGSLTPLASLAYEVPLYDKFRVVARHLALYSFAVVALASLAIGAAQEGRLASRRVLTTLGVLALATGLGLWYTASRPDLFDFGCNGHGFGRLLPVKLSDPWLQAMVSAIACLLLGLLAWRRTRPIGMALLPLAVAADLLNAQSEPVDAKGFQPPTIISRALVQPSVHAERLRALLLPEHQRLLPLEGSALDPLLPGAFARLWEVPSLGGYNPLLPGRLTRLAQMDANGAAKGRLMVPEDQTTNLFGVRYVVVRERAMVWPATLTAEAPVSMLPDLELELGPSDCQPRGPVQVTLAPPPGVDVAALVLDWELQCGDNIKRDQEVGVVELQGEGGALALPMRSEPEGAAFLGFRPVDENADRTRLSMAALQRALPQPRQVDRIVITTAGMPAWVHLRHLAVVDRGGQVHPLDLPQAALGVSERWTEQSRFRTSRNSDRGRDEDADGEDGLIVYQNRGARPGAWWVGQTVVVPDEGAVDVVRSGRLRDGTPWDPARTAFVADARGAELPAGSQPGSAPVRMQTFADGQIEVESDAPRPGIVVLAELHHPGWKAWLDGQSVPVMRVDHAVMGVPVPAGRHAVTLRFEPTSFVAGVGISGLALLVTLGCLFPLPGAAARRRRAASSTTRA